MSHDDRTGEMPLYDRVRIWIDDNRIHTSAEFEQRREQFVFRLMDDGFRITDINDTFLRWEDEVFKKHGRWSIFDGLAKCIIISQVFVVVIIASPFAIAWIFFD